MLSITSARQIAPLALLLVFFSTICAVATPSNATDLAVMPMPRTVSTSQGQLRLGLISAAATGYRDARLERGIARALRRICARTVYDVPQIGTDPNATLIVNVEAAGMEIQGLAEDESYALDVSTRQINLRARTVVGALRGLETLLQLPQADQRGFFLPVVKIEDAPRFPWRGLVVDPARHWLSVEAIQRILDGMAVVKLNVLHWHLSDDQGFRVESLRFPLLHQLGSDGSFYPEEEIRSVVAYARDRGIRVVPEFDMPGHAHSWFIGYPQFASAPGPYAFKYYLGGDSVPFDPSNEKTYEFIDEFIGEMAPLFPDQYWHVGGDEVDGTPWDANPAIQEFKKKNGLKDNAALQLYFNRRVLQIVTKHGKQMIGWDEILHPDLPKDAVVESWQGAESLATAANSGFNGILAAPYYLDKMFNTSVYYSADPASASNPLSPDAGAHILGGEAAMWGEVVSEENIESRIWPYSAAIAERLWSPREVTDIPDMYRRLDIVTFRLEEAGARHLSNPEMMWRRVAGGDVPASVRHILGLFEPLRLGLRQHERRPNQRTPLTAMGDIVVADSPDARRFEREVEAFLADAPKFEKFRADLDAQFAEWQLAKSAMRDLANRAPTFRDGIATSDDMADVGVAGSQALAFIRERKPAPKEWMEKQMLLLDKAAKPKGLLRIAVLDAMRKLISACGQLN
jgi:hexosaminidase